MISNSMTLPAHNEGQILPWAAMSQAELRFEAGDYIGCAAWLREAITLRIDIMLFRWNVQPPKRRKRKLRLKYLTVKERIALLHDASALDAWAAGVVTDAIDSCNKLIHLCFIPASQLSFAISIGRLLLDESDDPSWPRLAAESEALV